MPVPPSIKNTTGTNKSWLERGDTVAHQEHSCASDAPASYGKSAHEASELPFFTNYDCPHFPCHTGVAPEEFNCLFCFCPLYTLGPACGGNFTYTARGVKSCINCALPHQGNNGNTMVNERFSSLAELAKDATC